MQHTLFSDLLASSPSTDLGTYPISSPLELNQRLDQLTAWAIFRDRPMMVTLTDDDLPDGPVLAICIGAARRRADWFDGAHARWATSGG